MKGASTTYHHNDPGKEAERQKQLAEERSFTPKQIVKRFPLDWLVKTDSYHQAIGHQALSELIQNPFDPTDNSTKLQDAAKHNLNPDYGDDIEDLIFEDEIISGLIELKRNHLDDEHSAELIRIRRTVIVGLLSQPDVSKAS